MTSTFSGESERMKGTQKACTPDADALRKKKQSYRQRMKKTYDRRHRVVQPESIVPGNVVWIPDLQKTGTVVREHDAPRSLIIKTPDGTVRRNRQMTRRLDAAADVGRDDAAAVADQPPTPPPRATRIAKKPKRLIREI
jgi:hypothetical protein